MNKKSKIKLIILNAIEFVFSVSLMVLASFISTRFMNNLYPSNLVTIANLLIKAGDVIGTLGVVHSIYGYTMINKKVEG